MTNLSSHDDALAFREAIAQWQLAARTAVKRCSSLPSRLFDACDPMLEAQLAETVRQLMEKLQKPIAIDQAETPEQRRENVETAELAQLRRRAGEGSARVELYAGQMAELLGVLLDTVVTAPRHGREAALAVLRDEFGISEQTNLDEAARTLSDVVGQHLGTDAEAVVDADVEQQIAALCSQIAGAALLQSRRHGAERAGEPRPEAPQ